MQLSLNGVSRAKCYISQEELQDLEKKLQDVSQTLDLIKNGNAFSMRHNNFTPVWLYQDKLASMTKFCKLESLRLPI